MRLLPAILLSVSVLIAAMIVVSIPLFFPTTSAGGGGSVDNQARIDIELLHGDMTALNDTVNELRDQVDSLEDRVNQIEVAAQPQALDGSNGLQIITPDGDNGISGNYAQVVLVAARRGLNSGLKVPTSSFMVGQFGLPAENLNDDCQPITNPRLATLLEERQVGPIQAKMLKPALDSLQVIFDKIQRADPDLYARINTAGTICARWIRGSTTSVSSHSFGTAIDLNIDGVLDTLGDGRTQLGLTIMSDFFNADGWVWGAAYGREDSMHFEVSEDKIKEWVAAGLL
ncbi:M15 family metallopeptidase [Rhodobacter sp. KR11]|uniref:M15 family metallopeptidase n=1 Tax=Rhodobacter sp. KR11 TaxID=2974588 RepID=UPI002221E4F3|nr:M15 family metallopeptidase [Rhodobacter sp. KR11]MCW1917930.1 M15 family metallopeptidase [Rhodobacter sp. KR11]